jgi:ABC-type multidrug transport system fused ATPase/permease subunit
MEVPPTDPQDEDSPRPTRRESLQSTRPDYFASLRRNSVASLLEESPLQQSIRNVLKPAESLNQVEVRLKNYSRTISVRTDAPSIKTVFNTSPCYVGMEFVSNAGEIITGSKKVKDIFGHYEKQYILNDINLVLKPGTTYLVMGPPGTTSHFS